MGGCWAGWGGDVCLVHCSSVGLANGTMFPVEGEGGGVWEKGMRATA